MQTLNTMTYHGPLKTSRTSGLTDRISERAANEISHFLEDKSDRDWFGSDRSLKVSLFDYNWVAHPTGDDAWVSILRINRTYPGGPGFKIHLIEKDEIREFIFSDVFRETIGESIGAIGEHATYKSVEAFWNHEHIRRMLGIYIRYKDGLFYPTHAYDSPIPENELLDILRESENSDA